jgi:ATP-dependent Lon protease
MKRQRYERKTKYQNVDSKKEDNESGSIFSDSNDDDYDYNDPFIEDDRKKSKKDGVTNSKIEEIKSAICDREITIEKVILLNMPLDDYVWFMEHIIIMKNTSDAEQRYKIKTMLYDKYMYMSSIDTKKLSHIKSITNIDTDIVTRILNSKHDDMTKAIMYKKYRRVEDKSLDEQYKIVDWIENVLSIPLTSHTVTTSSVNVNKILSKLWIALNKNIIGLNDIKEQMMEIMCSKLINPECNGKILTLAGPPGVGKTVLALSLAESLEMAFDQISMGSIKDASVLTGHASTYIGATSGLFSKMLIRHKRLDILLLIDEVDKIPNTPEGNSVEAVLMHALDKTQNNKFADMYMPEIPIDLSKITFVLSANNIDNIDPILLDRMSVINMTGYSTEEKANIVEHNMFPKFITMLRFGKDDISMSREVILYMISKTVTQPGMRDIEKRLLRFLERISLWKHAKDIQLTYADGVPKFPLKITTHLIDTMFV